jgi:spore maturation protein CgeB
VPWYASHRDLAQPPFGRTRLYASLEELKDGFAREVRDADVVIVGSYVPQGVAVGEWVTATARGVAAFYDIDTPVTLAKLERGDTEYLSRELVPRYGLYLSFTGGPTLRRLERELGSPRARALYCSFDPSLYFPEERARRWDLGYLGTYSACRQPPLEKLMLEAGRRWKDARMVVAGPQYPANVDWPSNVERIEHLPPAEHRAFYNAQAYTLNVTRSDMVAAGYSPSVRLFEAAACGTPIISDAWNGLDTIFRVGTEILISRSARETLRYLRELPEEERLAIGERARKRALAEHTAAHRAEELEGHALEAIAARKVARVARLKRPASVVG